MSVYHGEKDETENKCSSGKESPTGVYSSLLVIRDIKYATTFSFLGLSTIMMSNSWSNNNHLVTLALVTSLFIKYLIVEWSVWTNVRYPVK